MVRISKTEAAARRAHATSEIVAHTGIDDAMIANLVHAFYARIRDDSQLGPIFNARIEDWDAHLQRMCDFWSSIVLRSGRYHGTPMQKHLALPVDATDFDHWLALFEATARKVCPPAAAAHFVERARHIAQSLEIGVASSNGVLLKPGARYLRTDVSHPQQDKPERPDSGV